MANTPEVQPFKPPMKLTPEERTKRYEELRERMIKGPLFVESRDPDMHLRWVRNDPNDIATHRHLGYDFVTSRKDVPEHQRPVKTYVPLSVDGEYHHGDVILMQIDRETHEWYQQQDIEYAIRLAGAGKENFKDSARRLGVPVFERDQYGQIIH